MFQRKKQRPPQEASTPENSPPDDSPQSTFTTSTMPTTQPTAPSSSVGTTPDTSAAAQPSRQAKQLKKKASLGLFPRMGKATTSTAVTTDMAVGGTLRPQASADFGRYDAGRGSETASLRSTTESTGGPSTNVAKAKEPSTLADKRSVGSKPASIKSSAEVTTKPKSDPKASKSQPSAPEPTPTTPNDDNRDDGDDARSITDSILSPPVPGTPVRPSTPVGWLGWLGWGGEEQTSPMASQSEKAGETTETTPGETTESEAPPAELASPQSSNTAEAERPQTSGGWIEYLWASVPANPLAASTGQARPQEEQKDGQTPDQKPPVEDTSPMTDAEMAALRPTSPAAGSTWAFWSRESGVKSSASSTSREPGEFAVIGDMSESHPTPANRGEIDPSTAKGKTPQAKEAKKPASSAQKQQESIQQDDKGVVSEEEKTKPEAVKANEARPLSGKAKRTKQAQAEALEMQRPGTPTAPSTPATKPAAAATAPASEDAASSTQGSSNLLLPSFDSTYAMKNNPSITRQIGRLLLRSAPIPMPATQVAHPIPGYPSTQVFRSKRVPKIKRAVAIGVHGIFPHTYLRAMIGQPTGTSLRFASLCAESIRRWADANGSPECEIEKVALEGEGKIAERVDNLWKLLLNWIEHLRQADVIMMACHSQGVPVGIMLLSKLIELKIITHARIGVCAMAGVSQGPFPYRTASMMGGSAAELLEFANPTSVVAQNYELALRDVLAYGGRITYISSIDDQLVPMESAIHSPLHHPYIYRAVFVDGRIHAPDFLAHLIGFALKLRNLGISDHGLIRELSSPLAGSLYTGEGHSRLYFDSQVYDLAIQHSLETTDVTPHTEPEFRHPTSGTVGVANANPYHLPWIMRGLLEENRVKTELSDETAELLQKFDDWNPVTAKLKEVKYKLEAIKSNL